MHRSPDPGPLYMPHYGAPSESETIPEAQRTGLLPIAARAVLQDVEDAAAAANAAVNTTHDTIRREIETKQQNQVALRDFENHPKARKGDATHRSYLATIEEINRRIGVLDQRAAKEGARWNALGQLRRALREWRADNASRFIVAVAVPTPKLAKGEAAKDALDRLRKQIAAMGVESTQIADAPLTSTEAKALARRYVETLRMRGRPDVAPFFLGMASPEWPNLPSYFQHGARLSDGTPTVAAGVNHDAAGMMAWLYGDDMLAELEAAIDAAADDKRAVSAEAKVKRQGEIAGKKLAAEREEEALVRALIEDGMVVERRSDADPRAVLMVEALDELPAKAA